MPTSPRQEPTLSAHQAPSDSLLQAVPGAEATGQRAAPRSAPGMPPQASRPRWLRRLLWLLLALLLGLGGAVAALWWWLGQPQSLAQSLALAQRWLPAQQQLQVQQVQGSIRHGGRIGQLHWQGPGIEVRLEGLQLDWNLTPLLLSQQLLVDKLHLQALHIRSEPSPEAAEDKDTPPLSALPLPLHTVHLPLHIERLTWADAQSAQLQAVQLLYRFDGEHHRLHLQQLHYDQGRYQGQIQLQADSPMQLQAQVQGQLQTPAQLLEQPLHIHLQASVDGELAGEDARLNLQAQAVQTQPPESAESTESPAPATPETPKAPETPSERLHAQVQAVITPWQAQPLPLADVDMQHLNLGIFAPHLPRTQLQGRIQARAQPDAQWLLEAELSNTQAAPWDQHALPVQALSARLLWDGPRWQVQHLEVALPTIAGQSGGHLQAQANYHADDGTLQAQATLAAINPAHLLSSLDSQGLSGTLEVSTQLPISPPASAEPQPETATAIGEEAAPPASAPLAGPVDFAVHIQASDPRHTQGLQSLQAQGQWLHEQLTVRDLELTAFQAQLRSPHLQWQQAEQRLHSPEGIALSLPGASAHWQGSLGAHQGQGKLDIALQALPTLLAWAEKLPGQAPLKPALEGLNGLDGQAQAQLQWQGGWGKLLERFAPTEASAAQSPPKIAQTSAKTSARTHPDSGLQLQAQLHLPQLRYRPPGSANRANSPSSQVQDLRLSLQGTPEALAIALTAQAQHGPQRLQIHAQGQAGLARQGAAQDWQAQLEKLQLYARPDADSGDWQLQLAQAFSARQQGQQLSASAGQLHIIPPRQPASLGKQAAATPTSLHWSAITLHQASGNSPPGHKSNSLGGWHLQTQGRLEHLPLAWVDLFSPDPEQPLLESVGMSGDLILQGQWDIDTTQAQPRLFARLERASGDVRLAAASQEDAASITVVRSSGSSSAEQEQRRLRPGSRGRRVRLENFHLELGLEKEQLRVQGIWASQHAGTILADLHSPLKRSSQGWDWPENAPIEGTIQSALPDLGSWAMFVPPGWRIIGSLGSDIRISGTRSDPQWQGELRANNFGISSLLEGVNLKNGHFLARFAGTRVEIEHLQLEGGANNQARILGMSGNLTEPPTDGGRITGKGYMAYDPSSNSGAGGIDMDVQLQAEGLQVLIRADRQMGISGTVNARMHNEQLRLRGQLTVDRAALLLADESAPGLDEDVHITSAAQRQLEAQRQAKAERKAARQPPPEGSVRTAMQPDIDLRIDLGPDFALQGYGITTRLGGQLNVQGGPRLTGEIHTIQGRFRAWGQSLDVEQGTIRFNGPYDNPSLDIIALRPNLPVRAGAKVMGSANAPRVQLFSEPDMPDAEKLSWIVMGRDPAEGGAESALLQQAALAMLSGGGGGGNFAGQIGLDEVGIKGGGDGGEGAALTLGKRISKDLYVAYEQSLSGATGTLLMFYDLSRRLTLRGQTGEQTAIDLVYTRKKD